MLSLSMQPKQSATFRNAVLLQDEGFPSRYDENRFVNFAMTTEA